MDEDQDQVQPAVHGQTTSGGLSSGGGAHHPSVGVHDFSKMSNSELADRANYLRQKMKFGEANGADSSQAGQIGFEMLGRGSGNASSGTNGSSTPAASKASASDDDGDDAAQFKPSQSTPSQSAPSQSSPSPSTPKASRFAPAPQKAPGSDPSVSSFYSDDNRKTQDNGLREPRRYNKMSDEHLGTIAKIFSTDSTYTNGHKITSQDSVENAAINREYARRAKRTAQ